MQNSLRAARVSLITSTALSFIHILANTPACKSPSFEQLHHEHNAHQELQPGVCVAIGFFLDHTIDALVQLWLQYNQISSNRRNLAGNTPQPSYLVCRETLEDDVLLGC